jgi:hypothetical protein
MVLTIESKHCTKNRLSDRSLGWLEKSVEWQKPWVNYISQSIENTTGRRPRVHSCIILGWLESIFQNVRECMLPFFLGFLLPPCFGWRATRTWGIAVSNFTFVYVFICCIFMSFWFFCSNHPLKYLHISSLDTCAPDDHWPTWFFYCIARGILNTLLELFPVSSLDFTWKSLQEICLLLR